MMPTLYSCIDILYSYFLIINLFVCGGIYGGIMTSLYNRNGGTVQLCPNILHYIQCMHIYVNLLMHTSLVSYTWSAAEHYTIYGHNPIYTPLIISIY